MFINPKGPTVKFFEKDLAHHQETYNNQADMKWGLLLSLTLLCISGFMAAVYELIANKNMWGVGQYFRLNGIMPIIGGVLAFGSVIASIILNPWWTGILIFVLGLIFSQIIIMIFKGGSQLVTIVLIIIASMLTYFFAFAQI